MKTRCTKCRKLIDFGDRLCEECKSNKIKEDKKSIKNKDAEKQIKSRRWTNKRKQILIRDKGVCQLCFKRGIISRRRLQVHHIVKRTEDESLVFEDSNLITVCPPCHEELEKLSPEKQRNILGISDKTAEIEFYI